MLDDISFNSCEVLPFGFGIRDHFPIFVYVNTMSFIGEMMVKISNPKVRRLYSCITQVRDKYIVICKRRWSIQIILRKIHKIFKEIEGLLNPKIMEKIDRLKEDTIKFAVRCCRKIRMWGVYFIKTLNKLGKTW